MSTGYREFLGSIQAFSEGGVKWKPPNLSQVSLCFSLTRPQRSTT